MKRFVVRLRWVHVRRCQRSSPRKWHCKSDAEEEDPIAIQPQGGQEAVASFFAEQACFACKACLLVFSVRKGPYGCNSFCEANCGLSKLLALVQSCGVTLDISGDWNWGADCTWPVKSCQRVDVSTWFHFVVTDYGLHGRVEKDEHAAFLTRPSLLER